MTNDEAMRYVEAILKQAAEDWRGLCDSETETKDKNFKELEEFFTVDLHIFLSPTNITAESVYEEALARRKAAGM